MRRHREGSRGLGAHRTLLHHRPRSSAAGATRHPVQQIGKRKYNKYKDGVYTLPASNPFPNSDYFWLRGPDGLRGNDSAPRSQQRCHRRVTGRVWLCSSKTSSTHLAKPHSIGSPRPQPRAEKAMPR